MSQMIPIQAPPSYALGPANGPGTPAGPPGLADREDAIPIASVVGMLRRHWLLIGVIVGASLFAANLVTRSTRPVYQASTTLYFADRESTVPALDILDQIENGNGEVAT